MCYACVHKHTLFLNGWEKHLQENTLAFENKLIANGAEIMVSNNITVTMVPETAIFHTGSHDSVVAHVMDISHVKQTPNLYSAILMRVLIYT